MKQLSIVLSMFIFLSNSYSQKDTSLWDLKIFGDDSIWMKKPNKADIAMQQGNYNTAIFEYKKLILLHPNETTNIYNLSCVYSKINQVDSAFKYLESSIINDSSVSMLNDPDFYNIISNKRWAILEHQQINKNKLASKINFKNELIAKELWEMHIKDQAYYSDIDMYEKRYGKNNTKSDSLWKIKQNLNKDNLLKLSKIIKNYGWPKKSEFGDYAANTVFLIVQHADYITQKKYLLQLEIACKQNEAAWEKYALLLDRILVFENKPQIYGTQLKYNKEKKQNELYPIKDEINIDIRRRKMGLSSLKVYLSNWGIEYKLPENLKGK